MGKPTITIEATAFGMLVLNARIFAECKKRYDALPESLRNGADEMLGIVHGESTEDEKQAALGTLAELLFPDNAEW